jgi:hypothetical protein
MELFERMGLEELRTGLEELLITLVRHAEKTRS